MLVPPDQREGVVDAVEARIAGEYASAQHADAPARPFTAISVPRQRDGYVEQVETEYQVNPSDAPAPSKRGASAGDAGPDGDRKRRPRRA